jgi:hypothetical protein
MKRRNSKDLAALKRESLAVEKAVQEGVREALLDHKRQGHSIVECDEDGTIRRVPADEIEFDAGDGKRPTP